MPQCFGGRRLPWRIYSIGWMCLGLLGCGGEETPHQLTNLVPVSGSVKFKGEPVPGAVVMLYPADADAVAKPPIASGVVEPDGSFEVKSTISRFIEEGAAPGSYQLTVSWLEAAPTPLDREAVKERLPKKYQNPKTSGLVADIGENESDLGEITLDVK